MPTSIPLPATDGDDDRADTLIGPPPTTRVAGGAIPLSGSPDDEQQTVISPPPTTRPRAAAIPLPAPPADDDGSATHVTAPPLFLSNLPNAPAPTDDTVTKTIPDLPAPVEASQAVFDDLPAVDTDVTELPATDDSEDTAVLDLDGHHDVALDDLPAPAGDPTPLAPDTSDLPAPVTADQSDDSATVQINLGDLPVEARPEPSDLPTEAPRLMDDLPIADVSFDAETLPTEPLADPAAAARARSTSTTPSAAVTNDPTAAAAAPGDGKSATSLRAGIRPRTLAIGAGAAAVVLIAVAATVVFGTPWLGMQRFQLPFTTKPHAPTPSPTPPPQKPPALATTPSATPPPAPTPAPAPIPTPPPKPPTPTLTADNVDQLGWSALAAAVTAQAAKSPADGAGASVLKWARFRLASTYGDAAAKELVVAAAADKPVIPKLDGIGAAALVGSLWMAGKAPAARKLGERLLKGKHKDVPQLAYAVAKTYDRRPELAKGLKQVERALKTTPPLPDAHLLHAALLLATRDKATAVGELVQLVTKNPEPDVAVAAAEALLNGAEVSRLDEVLAKVIDLEQAGEIAPIRRGLFLKLLVRKRVRSGDVDGALAAAEARQAMEPQDIEALIELARLTAAGGGDVDAVLKKLPADADDADKARLTAEKARLDVLRGDLDAAKKTVAAGAAYEVRGASPWLKLAEGWIAEKSELLPAARAAYVAASKGKAKLAPARLALVRLGNDKPGALMKKLSDLDRIDGLTEATLELARVMQARGNPGGASQLFDRVLWQDPTLGEPVALVLQWADSLDQAGQSSRAESVVKSLHDARTDDPRPVHQLISMARRAGRFDAAADWYRLLVTADPKNFHLKVGLAEVLNDAGKDTEAVALLDELFKASPEAANDADAVAQKARAIAAKDPFNAKQLFTKSLELKPQAKTYMMRGATEEKRGNLENAQGDYQKALELEPELTAASLKIARIAFDRREFGQAVKVLEVVLARNPQHAKAAELQGDTLVELNKAKEAVSRYEVALAAGGDNAPLLMKIAKLQIQILGQVEASVKVLRRAIKADPKLAEAHYFLGLALKDGGQYDEAKNELQAYARMAPTGEYAAEAKRSAADMESP